MRGDDDGPADAQACLDDAALHDGQFFVRNFDAQIAARHHDGVGFVDDGLQIGDGLLVFNLGDDERMRFAFCKHFPELEQVAGFAHEGQRDEIHSEFEAKLDVLDVLGGERRQADFDAGQVDVAPAAELAFGEDFAFHLVAFLGEHFHLDRAVVNQHHVTNADVVDEIFVVHVHGMLFQVAFTAHGKGEFLAGLQVERHAQVAGADGRALRVHHDAGVAGALGGFVADGLEHAAHPVMGRVRHVQAEDVHARVHELADHLGGIRGRTKGGNDFRSAHNDASLHGRRIKR